MLLRCRARNHQDREQYPGQFHLPTMWGGGPGREATTAEGRIELPRTSVKFKTA